MVQLAHQTWGTKSHSAAMTIGFSGLDLTTAVISWTFSFLHYWQRLFFPSCKAFNEHFIWESNFLMLICALLVRLKDCTLLSLQQHFTDFNPNQSDFYDQVSKLKHENCMLLVLYKQFALPMKFCTKCSIFKRLNYRHKA